MEEAYSSPGSTYHDIKSCSPPKQVSKLKETSPSLYLNACVPVDQNGAPKTQPLPILQWKWEHITMDFVTSLPRSSQSHDVIWLVVD